jgi:dihydrofolate reductase
MGTITADLFITLDGVYQAPGGREEDLSDGFPFGGWQGAFAGEEMGETVVAEIERIDALLLGRRTYDIFAGYWPHHDDVIGAKFNAVPKFVASRTLGEPSWRGTTVVRDVAGEIAALKQRFENIHVIGSGDLTRSLIAADLLDRLHLYLYPVAFGQGKRLFEGAVPAAFRLVEPARSMADGPVSLVYERNGVPVTGIEMG